MSGQEIFVIVIVVLLLFGADKLPEIAKGIGKGMRDFRKATDDIKREFEESTREIRRDLNDVTNTIKTEVNDISGSITKDVTEATDNINKQINQVTGDIQNTVNDVKTDIGKDAAGIMENPEKGGIEVKDDGAGDSAANKETYKRNINEPDDNYYNYGYNND